MLSMTNTEPVTIGLNLGNHNIFPQNRVKVFNYKSKN